MNNKLLCSLIAVAGLYGCGSSSDAPSDKTPTTETPTATTYSQLYGYLYWEYGLPLSDIQRRSDGWVTTEMIDNPNLIVQTGYYNLRFDADDVALTGFDASTGSDYMSALTEDVTTFSTASMLIEVDVNDITYTATSGVIEATDDYWFNVRLIEAGQYVQRFDHMGLVFTDKDGNTLEGTTYFEVTAWPDRVVFTLDMSNVENVSRSKIQITSPNGVIHKIDEEKNKVNLALKPQEDLTLQELSPDTYITKAYDRSTEKTLEVSFDSDEYAFRIDFAPTNTSYPDDIDHYDEYVIEVTNPSNSEINVPLVFNETTVRNITGTVMTLVEDEDGRPSGQAVQISKNWHSDSDYVINHEGTWLRGSTMVTVDANSSKTLRLRVIAGYWDQVGSASHAQLSLIGYSSRCWQWDESALGSWGESMTFDPYSGIAGAFIADVRPTWTTPLNGTSTDHNWTENVGGGDFLIYYDENGDYRWPKKLKTAYRWTGPNMTEVLYSGVTDDDAIQFTYTTQLVRSNDYHRRFQQFDYEILKDISPTRLVYYQMAADYYNSPDFENYYQGNNAGLIDAVTPTQGGNEYISVDSFDNTWIAIEDTVSGNDTATGYRGLLWRKSTINDIDSALYMHSYARTYGQGTLLFDISGNTTNQDYYKGSKISAEIEFIIPAQSSELYWGYDANFSNRLSSYSSAWQAVMDEYTYNEMTVVASKGEVIKHYPVTIQPESSSSVDVQFTIPAQKGIGHIPVIVQNAAANQALYAQYYQDGAWVSAVQNSANVATHASYQGYLNADGTMDYVFNIIRPAVSLEDALIIRIYSGD